jgi:hypothetical protein
MKFFLYEIVARVVAAYLCFNCWRRLRRGLAERKIAVVNPTRIDWSRWVVHRDAAPIQYWIQIGLLMLGLVACLLVAILGWWHPGS